MFNKITIIGDGGMGTVSAMILCEKGLDVTMWGHDRDILAQIARAGENVHYFPGYKLPDSLKFESEDSKCMTGAELILSAVPCQFVRTVFNRLKAYVPAGVPFAGVTKGIENKKLLRPSEIICDVIGREVGYAALSGPTIADELARKMPATITAACPDADLAERVQETFSTDYLRVYTNTDIVGVELAGAMKNVIAIAAGIIDGVNAGDNAKAALVSRGLAEMSRLGEKMGADEHTFAGLSGLGDLVTTCISPSGRNRSFGQRLGSGMTAAQALGATSSVVEGAATCESVLELAKKHHVEMPITEAVHAIIKNEKSIENAIHDLMTRSLKAE